MPTLQLMNRIGYMAQSDALYEDLIGERKLAILFGALWFERGEAGASNEEVMELVQLSNDVTKLVSNFFGRHETTTVTCHCAPS